MPSGTLFALLALQRCPKGANVHIYSQPDSHSPQQSPSWATDMSGLPAAGPSVGYTKDQLLSGPTMAAWSQSVLGVGGHLVHPLVLSANGVPGTGVHR